MKRSILRRDREEKNEMIEDERREERGDGRLITSRLFNSLCLQHIRFLHQQDCEVAAGISQHCTLQAIAEISVSQGIENLKGNK